MKRTYTIVVTKAMYETPYYRAIVAEIPMCETEGENLNDVIKQAEKAIGLSIRGGEMGLHADGPASVIRFEAETP